MGSGVGEEQTYARQLEHLLNDADSRRTHEVLNLGLAGLNLRAILQRLEAIGLRYEPDLIVYGWTVNDIEGPAYRRTTAPPVVLIPPSSSCAGRRRDGESCVTLPTRSHPPACT